MNLDIVCATVMIVISVVGMGIAVCVCIDENADRIIEAIRESKKEA